MIFGGFMVQDKLTNYYGKRFNTIYGDEGDKSPSASTIL